MIRRTPRSTPFPYTTLCLSRLVQESPMARLPAKQADCLARVHVLVQGEGLGEVPHGLAGLGEREGDFAEALAQNQHVDRSEEHTSELQSQSNLVCRLLLEKK